jgi:hypothetical protein
MFAASGFSCANSGIAEHPSRQKTKIENLRARMVSSGKLLEMAEIICPFDVLWTRSGTPAE